MTISFRNDFGRGYWWPLYDSKPEACFKKVQTHLTDMDFAIDMCKNKKVCVQAGGHAGLWAERLSTKFDSVITFEPDNILFECMKLNLAGIENITMINACLGKTNEDVVYYNQHSSAGSGTITKDNNPNSYSVRQYKMDDLVSYCDVIFLDVEGYELNVLDGAKKLIKTCKPIIMLESWKDKKPLQIEYMEKINYEYLGRFGRDIIFKYKDIQNV